MARTFRRKHTAHPIAELNVTNLIDLAFTLLIIFMIATPLIEMEQTVRVDLPTESKRPQKSDPDQKFQIIAINREGQYFWGSRPIDFSELPGLLEETAKQPQHPVIHIRADWTLQYQKIVSVMDQLGKHNLTKVSLDTQISK